MTIGKNKSRSWPLLRSYLLIILMVAIITAVGKALQPAFDVVNIALLYLLPVLVAAVRWGLWPSIAASLLGILFFNYFFIPPVMSFTVSDIRHLLNFALYLLVALVTGTLASRLKGEAEAARERERRTAALYSLSTKIAPTMDIRDILRSVAVTVAENMEAETAILMPGSIYNLLETVAVSGEGEFLLDHHEKASAGLVFEHGRQAGPETGAPTGPQLFFVPISDGEKSLGVLALRFGADRIMTSEERKDLTAFASLTALAITRAHLSSEAEQAKWLAESEKLHRSLLNAVSHDLRTPLSSIMGAVTGLLTEGHLYDQETQITLLRTIREGAQRMNRFIANLLDMARLESGILRLRKEWCDVMDLVGVSLKEIEDGLPHHRLKLTLPEDLPLVEADFGLMEQVLLNLLENAVKYSPPESVIILAAARRDDELRIAVSDDGPTVPEEDRLRIFDKFYRLRSSKDATGTGLGLSICKGIIEAHGGRIWVEPGDQGGNRFVLALPLSTEKTPVMSPEGAKYAG